LFKRNASTVLGVLVANRHPRSSRPEIAGAFPTEIPCWKRVLDVGCILLSLPCWLTIMIGVALWIKTASPGPIFYWQERVGYRGRRFMMFKFRTMKVNVDTLCHEHHLERLIQSNCPMTKLDASGDPRIIRGGRILRATGLDELPQLFNVLRGEMSLVGPRPCTTHEFQRYQLWQQERVNALPGLTGYWQVHGKNKTTFSEMVEMDIFYARNMSLRQDLAITLRTLPAITVQLLEGRKPTRAQSGAGRSACDHQ
jgi:lipopolysaccharide/colanic/teichoic acid biosynthesis glycosyltransferase